MSACVRDALAREVEAADCLLAALPQSNHGNAIPGASATGRAALASCRVAGDLVVIAWVVAEGHVADTSVLTGAKADAGAISAFIVVPAFAARWEAFCGEDIRRLCSSQQGSRRASMSIVEFLWRQRLAAPVDALQVVRAIDCRSRNRRSTRGLTATRLSYGLKSNAGTRLARRFVAAALDRSAPLSGESIGTQELTDAAFEASAIQREREQPRQLRLADHDNRPVDVVAPPNPKIPQRVLLARRRTRALFFRCKARRILRAPALVATSIADGWNQNRGELRFGAFHRNACIERSAEARVGRHRKPCARRLAPRERR